MLPTGFTLQFIGPTVMEFKWDAAVGDFDNYVIVFFDKVQTEIDIKVIAKTETSYRYTFDNAAIAGMALYTQKGQTRSAPPVFPTQLPAVVIRK